MNNKYFLAIISFFAGVFAGGFGLYIFKMNKYDQDFQKKLKEMKDYYSKNKKEEKPATEKIVEETPIITEPERKDMMEEARKIASDEGYYKKRYGIVSDEDDDEEDDEEITEHYESFLQDDVTAQKPYLIEPNQFGDQEMYEMETWSKYLDNVITNGDDLPMNDESIEHCVSKDAIAQLDSSDDDSVFVRNEALKTDYQIIKVIRRYADG